MKRYIYLVLALFLSLSLLTGCSNPISTYNGASSPEKSSSINEAIKDTLPTLSQSNSLTAEEFKRKAEEKGLNEVMVHSLENLGFTKPEILNLESEKIAKIFAPGTNNDGSPAFQGTDMQYEELQKVGIDIDMSVILGNLDYKYDEMLGLTPDDIDFIFPNTELMANLEKKGLSKQEVEYLSEHGKTFKEIINTALNNLNESQINPYSQGVKLSQDNLTLEQIAKLVFENQMQYVEGSNYPDQSRIKDYKISTIRIEKIHDEGFIFSVDYSILPATNKFVLAGNGSIGDNGWINDKFHFVDVINVNGTYKIVSMATGRG